ncbi:hypothetical protein WT83_29050 [Burkholderia territorii]|uniref:Two-component system response regulator n=1 Tax=Burkholderia territorii TaxID=1503055 RepID=A0A119VDI4_9BURK|nr:response regulator transcription factor [Burkholderia territorii]KWN05611.1 hypothetical protein WT83_29050 [Burkholderia territorii]
MKIACLEDDSAHGELIRSALDEVFDVRIYCAGRQLIRALESEVVDLLILDLQVPDLSGLDVLAWVRQRLGGSVPILILTSCIHERSETLALDAGADDYMVKPAYAPKLRARINALLRRTQAHSIDSMSQFSVGHYMIDLHNHTITLNRRRIDLSEKEFGIVAMLFRQIGTVVPRNEIIKRVWGTDLGGLSRTLDTHICRIKAKLSLCSQHGVRLRAVYTHGYRLECIEPCEGI